MATQTGSIDLKGMTSAYSDQQQYFWVESSSSATWGGGAHITNIAESAFKTAAGTWGTDPTAGGYNLLMNTDTANETGSLQLRNGSLPIMNLDNDSLDFNTIDTTTTPYSTINVATFGVNGARIGDENSAHSIIDANGQRFYAVDGTTRLSNIGYGEGSNYNVGESVAPYYMFGSVDDDDIYVYDPSQYYYVGDLCKYSDSSTGSQKVYVALRDMESPGDWNSSYWQLAIGNYSCAIGTNSIASGDSSCSAGIAAKAIGHFSFAYGGYTKAVGVGSMAGGFDSMATGEESVAIGMGAVSRADSSVALGNGLYTSGYSQTVVGSCNRDDTTAFTKTTDTTVDPDKIYYGYNSTLYNFYMVQDPKDTDIANYYEHTPSSSKYVFIVGTGERRRDAQNGLTVDWDGNVKMAGSITDGQGFSIPHYSEAVITSYNSGWTVYASTDISAITVRKYGRFVTLTGVMKNTAKKTINTDEQTMFTIPEGYRPMQVSKAMCQGTDTATWMLTVNTNGTVTASRYRLHANSYPSVATGSWFPFHITYISAD